MGSYYSKNKVDKKSIENDETIHGYQPDLGFVGYGLSEEQSLQSLEKYLSLFFNIVIQKDEHGYFIKMKNYDRLNIHIYKIGNVYKSCLEL